MANKGTVFAVKETAKKLASQPRTCPDCNGTGKYTPLIGPPESCKTCQP